MRARAGLDLWCYLCLPGESAGGEERIEPIASVAASSPAVVGFAGAASVAIKARQDFKRQLQRLPQYPENEDSAVGRGSPLGRPAGDCSLEALTILLLCRLHKGHPTNPLFSLKHRFQQLSLPVRPTLQLDVEP
ncbi:unnamed protein product [Pleuronectes platessa]|uniref:Uncharacterized protein n=1 Tax=Pleuronectes platessa TaxID=8262 RepID=A0A9N7THR7_PLEPL|nr:unnamed protein product [Pleuronectes platessa]